MPDIHKLSGKKDTKDNMSLKRKSAEFKSKAAVSPTGGKKRKLEEITHVPSLVSSTFNPLEEVDFPRGGSTLTPLEKKEAENEGIRDALFETAEAGSSRKKIKGKKGRSNEYDMEAVLKYNGPRIEGLSFKRLVEGTLVLGQVSQINTHDIAIALPNNLTGYVSLTRISPQITKAIESAIGDDDSDDDEKAETESKLPSLDDLFTPGQWLRTVVVENTAISGATTKSKKKHIELSIEPEMVNASIAQEDIVPKTPLQVSINSIEDHGFVVSLGLPKLTGFIKKAALSGRAVDSIKEGQVLLACVVQKPKNGVVQLSLDLKASQTPIGDVGDMSSLLPGDTVQCLLTEIRDVGAGGKVLGMLDATIDQLHIGSASVAENKNITARITAVFPSGDPRRATLSILPHIVKLDVANTASGQAPLDALPIGFIIEAAKITKIVENQGVYVDIGVDGVPGFVHISRLSDQRVESLLSNDKTFKVSSVHQGRVTGYNPVDNLYLVSFEQKVLDQKFLRLEDVGLGSILEGTIEKAGDSGITVTLAEGITGWIPMQHSSDVLPGTDKKKAGKELLKWNKKFKEGSKIKCKVLNVDLTRRRILLTAKKTLLNSTMPLLSSYSASNIGKAFHGTIFSLTPHGAIVEFHAGIRGYLPVSEMSEAYINDATEHFRLGQTVKAWILNVEEAEKRMRLSLKDQSYWSQGGQAAFEALEEGTVVEATVSAKLVDKIVLDIPSGGVVLRGSVSVEHLSDSPGSKAEKKLAKMREGTKVKEVLVLSKNLQNRVIVCSMKPALIEAAKEGTFPSKYDELSRGRKVTGWVKNVEDFGAFVAFAGSVEGVVYKKDISEAHVDDARTALAKGQVVTATVVTVDTQLQRSQLSIKPQADRGLITADGQTEALNPLDPTIKFIEDYTPGRLTLAKVLAVKQTQANVALAENLQGRIDVSEIADTVLSDEDLPLKSLKKDAVLQVRILGFHDAKTHRYLPLTHRKSNTQTTLELSCKPNDIKVNPLPLPTLDDIKSGSIFPAYINKYTGEYLWLNISPTIRGRMHILSLTDKVEKLQNLMTNYPIGLGLSVTVLGKTDDGKYLNFAARKNIIRTLDDVSVGSILPGRVVKVHDSGLMIQISESVIGKVGLTDISDTYSAKVTEGYHENAIVRVCVLDVDKSNNKIALSTRASRTLSSSSKQTDHEISSISDIKLGQIIRGFVTNVADSGLFVGLARNVVGRVLIKDLSDQFLKDWKPHFKVNQLVKAKVLSVDSSAKKVGLSLKVSVVEGKGTEKGIDEINEGDKVSGSVSRVEDYGLFIRLDGYNLSGLCHKSEISDTSLGDFKKLYDEGDKVKAIVLTVDHDKRRVSLGLKASYFEDDDEEMPDVNGDGDMDDAGDVIETDSEPMEDDAMQIESYVPTPTESQAAPLAVEGFNWTGETIVGDDDEKALQSESDSEDEAAEEVVHQKKHKRSEIKHDKTLSLPMSSAADYERTLLSQPDSSLLWTQYMAHLLQLGETDKARSVAERALKTINIREEGEKFNIWVAYLNMENSFGTDESLDAIFQRACEYTDKKKMFLHLVSILIKSGKDDKADETFQTMIKKFSQASKVWVNYAAYLMEHGRVDEGRELLPRSLKILPKRKHVKTVSKFAQLEFKFSSPEHGRTIMTGLLANYPRRLDLWSVFLDLEIKQDDQDATRRLFQRVLAMKMSTKKAKFFFKKWLQWETESGDAAGVEDVKRKAREYVEGLAGE